MNNIRILCASLALSGLVAAQTSAPPPPARTTAQTSATPTANTSQSRVTLPSGTPIEVRVNESLSSESTPQGEKFTGTVTTDVTDPNTNRVIIPRGAEVTGRVLSATPSGRLSSSGELQLLLSTIRYGNAISNITVEPYVIKGESHTKSNATKVGGGAALGAIIGAIAGGGKGAAIGAGVGGAAGAGTAAATGKRPAEVQPEALLKFITSGDTSVTAADQSGYSNPAASSPSASQSSTWPEPSRPASTSTTRSTTTSTAPSADNSSDSSGTFNPDSSDAPPVMHRRDGSTASTPSATTDNSAGTAATRTTTSDTPTSTTTTASNNGTYGVSNPPPANSSVYGSATAPATTTGTTAPTTTSAPGTTVTTPAASTTTAAATSSLPDNRLFSARDRRVVNQCLKDNTASLPASYMHRGASASGYQRGQTIPVDIQRQLRSLPLACDNQLPAVSNDLERVIYGGQVMLIDSTNRVLDVFDVTP